MSGTPGVLIRLARQALANAREHPYLTALFGFWSFGYTIMVPQVLGGRYLPFLSEQMGGRPETLFVAFGLLMVNVVVFAFVVPFGLWMLVCWALGRDEEQDG
ncbi:MAG: hypothetical protein OEY97_01515 [Nitrospirota bacterium]|nr:hypothetical protein [Nitrospirota bacterium]